MNKMFEGRVFYHDSNNGVTAVMLDDHYEAVLQAQEIAATAANRLSAARRHNHTDVQENILKVLMRREQATVLTFTRAERTVDGEHQSPWFTGSFEDLELLKIFIEQEGGELRPAGFNVPFSNGLEEGFQGAGRQLEELQQYVATQAQIRKIFNGSLQDVFRKVRQRITDDEANRLKLV